MSPCATSSGQYSGQHLGCLCWSIYCAGVHACRSLHNSQLYSVQTVPVLTCFIHCPSGVRHFTAGCRLMLGPLTAHTFTLYSWPSPPKQDTLVATRPVPPLALTLMYFSTNVMFRTLHSNSTIYLSTLLPSGDVKPHAVVSKTCMVGVGRLPTSRMADNVILIGSFMGLPYLAWHNVSVVRICRSIEVDHKSCPLTLTFIMLNIRTSALHIPSIIGATAHKNVKFAKWMLQNEPKI